jgi:cytochrome P450
MLAFQKYGLDILGSITFYPSPRVVLFIADPDTVKEVTTHRAAFPKPVQLYKMFNIFGSNILATEGDEWRMHRNVVAKSFTEQNNKLIWAETIDCISSLFTIWEEESEKKGDREVVIESAADLTREITLMVLSATGTSA